MTARQLLVRDLLVLFGLTGWALALPAFASEFVVSLALTCLMYVALSSSWALFCGSTRYLSLAKKRGIRLLGAYSHALVPNTGLNLWALKGWEHWQQLMEAEPGDKELRAWTEGQREWLEDSDAFLVVQPPQGALRT